MSQSFIKLPRSTAYLSASLLLLPMALPAAAQTQSEWSCQAAANGGWSCLPKAIEPSSVAQPAPIPTTTSTAAPTSTTTPATKIAPATALKPLPAAIASAAKPAAPSGDIWDWVPNADASTAICCKPNAACDGLYVEPPRDWEDANQSPKNVPIRVNAAHSEWEGDVVKMDGGVTVTQGHLKVTADRAEMERSSNRVHLYGNVVLHQPGTKISGSTADVTTTDNLGNVADARLLDYKNGIRVSAEQLTRRKEELIELDQASYTRCPPDNEDWRMSARHIRLNRESGRGEAGDTVIRVADVPVFYTPYLNFPIDDRRQTGFLWPSFGSSSGGIDIAAPYYLNLAPDYDATITPREITDRGTMIETEARYLNRFSNWVVTATQLGSDQKTGGDRWFLGTQEQGQLNSYFSTAIDYSRVSDNNYFHDFSISSLNIKRQVSLNQQAALNLSYHNWFAQLTAQQYQTIDDLVNEPYKKLPQLTIARAADGASFQPDYNLLAEFTKFDHNTRDALTRGGPWVTGNRMYLEPGVSFPMRWASSYIAPELRLRHISDELSRPDGAPTGSDNPSTTVPQAILDAGVFFDRELTFSDTRFQQTLEPRLYYLYSPYKKQTDQQIFDTSPLTFDYHQLFQPRRFIGHDRLEDFNQAATGITSRLIEDESGRELGHVSLGQIFYFADRKVNTLNVETPDNQPNSSLAAQLALQPAPSLWNTANILWNPDKNQVEQGNVYLHYEPNERGIYNIGYRYNQPNPEVSTLANGIRQGDASAAWPLSQHWRAFLRINYDLNLHSALEDLAGVEYEDCCWVTRILYQRAVFGEELDALGQAKTQRQSAILVEFQLKGLGGIGRRVNTLLKESIWGFKDHD